MNHDIDTWVWVLIAVPFAFGSLIGVTAGYLLRAERASRERWAADRREVEWRRRLAHARTPRLYEPPRQRRPQPHRAPSTTASRG